jgi:hypothetical protein
VDGVASPQRVEGYIQNVVSVSALVLALGNVNVTVLHLLVDLQLGDAGVRIDGIVINRNVHIKGVGCNGGLNTPIKKLGFLCVRDTDGLPKGLPPSNNSG